MVKVEAVDIVSGQVVELMWDPKLGTMAGCVERPTGVNAYEEACPK